MAPVQSKLVPYKKLHQTSLIPVRASTPHGPTNFMSLGRIVVDKTTHHDNSQHIHLQGSNFSGATGVNIGSGTSTTSITNTTAPCSVKDSAWYEKGSKRRYRDDYKGAKGYDKNYNNKKVKADEDDERLPTMRELDSDSESDDDDDDDDDDDIIEIIDNKKRPAPAPAPATDPVNVVKRRHSYTGEAKTMFVDKFLQNLSAVTTLNKDMSEFQLKVKALRITKDELKEFNRVDNNAADVGNANDDVGNANNDVGDVVVVEADNNAGKTWCICEMPVEEYNEEIMSMVQCQGAACKQVWFHYNCIGKPKNWNPVNIDYYCAYCSRRNARV